MKRVVPQGMRVQFVFATAAKHELTPLLAEIRYGPTG